MIRKVWTKKKRDRIEQWIHYWIKMLSLEPCHADFDFCEEPHSDDGGSCTNMDIRSSFPYRSMSIRVFPRMADMSYRRVAQKTCHEIMHYVIKPITRNRLESDGHFGEFEEMVVDQLGMCFENMAHYLNMNNKRYK